MTLGALGLIVGSLFYVRRVSHKKKEEDPEGNKWARMLKGTKAIKASYSFLFLDRFVF